MRLIPACSVAAVAEALLTACYENSLKLAREKGIKTIAFPLISAGVYGYPQREAIRVAVETMKGHAEEFEEITLVLFGEREFAFAGEEFGEFVVD
jgi:O-acetyl-ADP-ribose deacetylase (regulator of RNase III)